MNIKEEAFVYRRFSPSDVQNNADTLEKVFKQVLAIQESEFAFAVLDTGSWTFHWIEGFANPHLPAFSDADAIAYALDFMKEFNKTLHQSYLTGASIFPKAFPTEYLRLHAPPMPISEPRSAGPISREEIVYYIVQFDVYLPFSKDNIAIPLEQATIKIYVGGGNQKSGSFGYPLASIMRIDADWRPIISRIGSDLAETASFTFIGTDKEIIEKIPIPGLFYWAPDEENILAPYRLGFSQLYMERIPLVKSYDSKTSELLEKEIDPYRISDRIDLIGQLPDSQLLLLLQLGFDISQHEGNTQFLTTLHDALNQFEILRFEHLSGEIGLNQDYESELTGNGHRINFERYSTKNRKASFHIKRQEVTIAITVQIDEEHCTAAYAFQYKNLATNVEYLSRHIDTLMCNVPKLSPNIDEDVSPLDQLVLVKTEAGIAVHKPDPGVAIPESANIRRITGADLMDRINASHLPYFNHEMAMELGMIGATVHVPFRDKAIANGKGITKSPNSKSSYGTIAEESLIGKKAWFQKDLNELPWTNSKGVVSRGNFPIFDSRGEVFSDRLYSTKTSIQSNRAKRFSYYDRGLDDIMGGKDRPRRAELFRRVSIELCNNLTISPDQAVKITMARGVLAINEEDVQPYRKTIRSRIEANLADYRAYFDALLLEEPLIVNGKSIASMADLDFIEANGGISPKQRVAFFDALITRVTNRIQSHGLTTKSVLRLFGLQKNYKGLSTKQIRSRVTQSEILIARLGYTKALGISGARGAGFGAAGMIAVELGRALFSGEKLDWVTLSKVGGVGAAGGFAGGVASTTTEGLLTQIGVTSKAVKLVGSGGVGGAIASPIIQIGLMAFDDKEYSSEDYIAKGTRAAVGGFVSGAVAAGLAGSIGGSEGGPVGMLIGFGIGYLAYELFDSVAGDPTEEIVRDIIRKIENRPIFILLGPWKIENFGFFAIAEVYLGKRNPILVQPKGPYVSYLNPNDDTEIIIVEVVAANDNATEFFEGRESLLVPLSILKPYIP